MLLTLASICPGIVRSDLLLNLTPDFKVPFVSPINKLDSALTSSSAADASSLTIDTTGLSVIASTIPSITLRTSATTIPGAMFDTNCTCTFSKTPIAVFKATLEVD